MIDNVHSSSLPVLSFKEPPFFSFRPTPADTGKRWRKQHNSKFKPCTCVSIKLISICEGKHCVLAGFPSNAYLVLRYCCHTAFRTEHLGHRRPFRIERVIGQAGRISK